MKNDAIFSNLKYLVGLKKGKNPSFFLDKGEIPYLSMDYLRGRERDTKYVEPEKKLVIVGEDEILILWDGANAGEIIKSKSGALSSTMALISPKKDVLEGSFLYYVLKNFERTLKNFAGGTTIPHLDPEILLHSSFFIPSLFIQKSIAAFLDEKTTKIDQAIAQKERLIALLKERKQIVIQQAVTKGLNPNARMKPSGIDWIGDIPEEWEVKRLKYVLELKNEKVSSLLSDLTYVGMENIESKSGKYIETKSEVEGLANVFRTGDILFGKLRPYLAKVYLAEFNGICSTEFLVYQNANSSYFSKMLSSDAFIRVVDASTYGAKMPRASSDFIGNLQIPVPPLEEQKAIVAHIETQSAKIDQAISLQQKQIEKLKEYKATLIDSAVTGKIKITVHDQ